MKNVYKLATFITITAAFHSCSKNAATMPKPAAVALAKTTNGILSQSDSSGVGGSAITITGGSFTADTSSNIVKFNGVKAVVNSATTTQLVVTVPTNATTGRITIAHNNVIDTVPGTFKVLHFVKTQSAGSPTGIQYLTFDKEGSGYYIFVDQQNHEHLIRHSATGGTDLFTTPVFSTSYRAANVIYTYSNSIHCVVVDKNDYVYVNNTITTDTSYVGGNTPDHFTEVTNVLRISPTGQVVTIGSFNGTTIQCTIDNLGNVYEYYYNAGVYGTTNGIISAHILKVTPQKVVSVVASSITAQLNGPGNDLQYQGLCLTTDNNNNVYFAIGGKTSTTVYKIDPSGNSSVYIPANGYAYSTDNPSGLIMNMFFDEKNNFYAALFDHRVIIKNTAGYISPFNLEPEVDYSYSFLYDKLGHYYRVGSQNDIDQFVLR